MIFKTIWTAIGLAKRANAEILGTLVSITHIAVGDGGGADIDPNQAMLALTNERHRRPVDSVLQDEVNPGWVNVEGRILVAEGGWWVREIGLFDADGDMVAVANYPATYKPILSEGAGQDLYLRMVLATENAAVINLTVNPAYAVASRDYVEKAVGNAASIRRVNASGNLLANDRIILVDASAGNIDLTFRSAAAADAKAVRIKRIDGTGNRLRLLPQAGQTIEWEGAIDLVRRGEAYHYVPDGVSKWVEVGGKPASGVKAIAAADSPYTLQTADSVLLVDASGGAVVIQFLEAAAVGAKRLTVKKIDGTGNAVQCTPQAAETIEGEAGSYDSITPGEFMSFVPDGATEWHRVG